VVALRKRQPDHDDEPDISGIRFSSPEEGHRLFDEQSRELLGISGSEFLRRWDAGHYQPVPDTAEGKNIRRLAMLMPFARRTHS
jgi:hypothetical protein